MLPELPAEMLQILVTALPAYLYNAVICINKQILGFSDPAGNHVVHAGQSEFLFVEQVQVACTHVQAFGHFGYAPIQLRIINDLSAERQKLVIMGRRRGMLNIVLKL